MQLRPFLLALACASLTTLAQAEPRQDHAMHNGNGPTPPAEAFAACVGKSEGARASLTTPRGEVSGTCSLIGGKLALRPDMRPGNGGGNGMGMGGHMGHGMPDAGMGGMQHGDRPMPGHDMKDMKGMQGHEEHMQGGRMQPPAEAINACKGKSEGSKASLTSPRGDTVSGTCMKMGKDLVLHPDNMPGMGQRPPRQ